MTIKHRTPKYAKGALPAILALTGNADSFSNPIREAIYRGIGNRRLQVGWNDWDEKRKFHFITVGRKKYKLDKNAERWLEWYNAGGAIGAQPTRGAFRLTLVQPNAKAASKKRSVRKKKSGGGTTLRSRKRTTTGITQPEQTQAPASFALPKSNQFGC